MNELGQMLRDAREAQGISLAEAEAQTRIRQKFIAAMEAEEWSLLPNDVTTRGFLRKYASYLGLEEEAALQRFQSQPNSAVAQPVLESPAERDGRLPADRNGPFLHAAAYDPLGLDWRCGGLAGAGRRCALHLLLPAQLSSLTCSPCRARCPVRAT